VRGAAKQCRFAEFEAVSVRFAGGNGVPVPSAALAGTTQARGSAAAVAAAKARIDPPRDCTAGG
jgi:hypothetical protein